MRGSIISLFLCSTVIMAQSPYLCFTDLVSGPAIGNSDNSQPGQVPGQDGAIITLWGKQLGPRTAQSRVLVGKQVARIYAWEEARQPADLSTTQGMQMVTFQLPHQAPDGLTEIRVETAAGQSNALPFTVRPGRIFFLKITGNDAGGDGSWSKPWATLDNVQNSGALNKLLPGDIIYIGDGVHHTALAGDRACIDLGDPGTAQLPKAIIGYPGADASIGQENIEKSYSLWVSGFGPTVHWTIAKLHLTGGSVAASMYHGFRIIGNKITAPRGDGPTGAVAGQGHELYLLGNELTNIGFAGTSKLYHPIYIQSAEACSGPRLPLERGREIAWNYLHDNLSYDGINIYRECGSSAFMVEHRVHDNYILNQTGCGIRIGDYVTGENWFYNNVVIHAGLGPNPAYEQAMHVPVLIHAGWEDTTTLIHFYNNTIYGGGYKNAAAWASSMIGFGNNRPFNLDFRNNLIISTQADITYLNSYLDQPRQGAMNNLWFGAGAAPDWDSLGQALDPQFVADDDLDLHLESSSPAVGRSWPQTSSYTWPLPERDFDGHRRNMSGLGTASGAYEFINLSTTAVKTLKNKSFQLYPNPARDIIQVLSPGLKEDTFLMVYDITGRIVWRQPVRRQAATYPLRWDVQGWPGGVYVVKLGAWAQKFVVRP